MSEVTELHVGPNVAQEPTRHIINPDNSQGALETQDLAIGHISAELIHRIAELRIGLIAQDLKKKSPPKKIGNKLNYGREILRILNLDGDDFEPSRFLRLINDTVIEFVEFTDISIDGIDKFDNLFNDLIAVFGLSKEDVTDTEKSKIIVNLKKLVDIERKLGLASNEVALADARYLIQSGVANSLSKKKTIETGEKNNGNPEETGEKNNANPDPHFLIELFEEIENSLRCFDLKHIWGLDLMRQFCLITHGNGIRKMNLNEFKSGGRIDVKNEEHNFFRGATEDSIEAYERSTIEHLAGIADRILDEILKGSDLDFDSSESNILKSTNIDDLTRIIQDNDISTPKKLRLRNLAIIRINLIHISYIIASKYSKKFSRQATDALISRLNFDSRFKYVKSTQIVNNNYDSDDDFETTDSHFRIKGFPGVKVYFADPKDEASIGRKVFVKRIDTNDFSRQIKDQARMSITVPNEFYEGEPEDVRARLLELIAILIPRTGTDFDFVRTREYIEKKISKTNSRTNPDRQSLQFTCNLKFVKPGKAQAKKSIANESAARRVCAIPLEIQILPEDLFVVDPKSPKYKAYKKERQGYEDRSRIEALENSGLLLSPVDFFKKLLAKALDFRCYTDTIDPEIVMKMIKVHIAYNKKRRNSPALYDPNTPTFKTIIRLLSSKYYQEYVDSMTLDEKQRLIIVLTTFLEVITKKNLSNKIKLVIERLNASITEIPENA